MHRNILSLGLAATVLSSLTAAQRVFEQSNGEVGPLFTEEVGGYTFIKSGPKDLKPHQEYEVGTGKTALRILKEALGPQGLIDVLQPAIVEADVFWHAVNDRSSPDKWVPTDGRAVVFLPNLTAASFAAWSTSPFADRSNNAANAEHYVKRSNILPSGALESEILEGWGGVTTHFKIPNYGPPNRTKYPFLRELPDFPVQASGDKVLLSDDTLFGVLHLSARDVSGDEYGQGSDGVDIFATVWYRDGVDDDHIEEERQHITIEIINQSIQAQKDIESGEFVPGAPSA